MKTIRIAFVDFWGTFDVSENIIVEILRKHYSVEIIDVNNIPREKYNGLGIEYLFYSCFGKEHLYFSDCIKIYYTGECIVPDFNECDYAIGFDHITFEDRYIRYPLAFFDFRKDVFNMMKRDELKNRREKFCAMVVSNNSCANPIREQFFYELSKYRRVDSGGRFLNNIGKPDGVADKREFLKDYKFSLAFENNKHSGYCTEKIVQSFGAGTIPIYWGDPRIFDYFNKKAFICVDENNIHEAIDMIKKVDNDDDLYRTMLEEPVIIGEKNLEETYDKNLEDWLVNIFSKSVSDARRIDYYGHSAWKVLHERPIENIVIEKYYDLEKRKPKTIYGIVKRKLKLLLK